MQPAYPGSIKRVARRGLVAAFVSIVALSLALPNSAAAEPVATTAAAPRVSAAAPAGSDATGASTTTSTPAPTGSAIAVTASASSIVAGTSIVVRYVVTSDGTPVAGAHTQVQYGGKTILQVTDTAGRGAINIRDLPVGSAAVIVRFAGDAEHGAATSRVTVTVAKAPTSFAGLAVSPGSSPAGTTPTLRLMVKSGASPLPRARVLVTSRGTTTAVTAGADGRVSFRLSSLPIGRTSILVRYTGDSLHAPARAMTNATITNPCPATAKACIDLTAAVTWIQDGGRIVYGPVPITSGRPGHRTRPGTFHVYWKDKDHRSAEFDGAPMPNSIFFDGGIAFHQGSLRVPSHGCIHLGAAASQAYWSRLAVGDAVFVWGSARY